MSEIELNKVVPFFAEADENLLNDFRDNVVAQRVKAGTYLSMEGDPCNYFPIIKSGLVRVFKLGSKGQEMTLYRIEPGQSCILTISCLLSKKTFPAVALVEEDCEVLLIQESVLREWLGKYNLWNQYIFDYLSRVLFNVINILENISFKSIDIRILEFLKSAFIKEGYEIQTTHQKIAIEIGTAREVVSRSLKQLEKQNILRLHRGKIVVTDSEKLQKELSLLQ
ncbi:MAG: Crp/Fnr family transcriptional regulator [Melioribacteraceae bacterium]|nr:Crp/Fnr family transcriptional regulator [Melioribacteraceae bacterium]